MSENIFHLCHSSASGKYSLLENFNLDCSERKIKHKGQRVTNWMYTGHWYDCYECLLKALFPSREKGHDDDQYYFYKLYKKYTSYYILTVTCQQHHQSTFRVGEMEFLFAVEG